MNHDNPIHTGEHAPALVPRRALLAAIAGAAGMAATGAWAAFPERPVKLMVGFSAGAAPDVIARTFQGPLAAALSQSVIIENRTGAGAQIAAGATASAPADGYTVLLAESGSTLVAQAAYSKLPYNTTRDLRVVATLTETPMVFVTGVNGPSNLRAFIGDIKAVKGTRLGTLGPGSTAHLLQTMLAANVGFDWEPVHYRAIGDLLAALVNGDVAGTFLAPSTVNSFVQAGKLRPLGTTSPVRLESLPQVPTLKEEGIASFEIMPWLAVFVPARTPEAVVERLATAFKTAMSDSKVRTQLATHGTLTNVRTGAEAQRYMQDETRWWETAVKKSGFKGD